MKTGRFIEAVSSSRPDGVGAADWSFHVTESRRLSLETKDRETGNAHAPLTLTESLGADYLICWQDGLVSRGGLERRQVEDDPEGALAAARAAAYEDADAAWVLGPASFPEVPLHDAEVARASGGDTNQVVVRWNQVREKVREAGCRTWSGAFRASEAGSRVLTSRGLDVSARGTLHSWHVHVDGEIGAGHSSRAFEPNADYAARLDRLMETARLLRVPAAPVAGGVHAVVLHPDVVEELVLATLLHHLDASTVAHGEGFFRRSQFGSSEPVLREDLTLGLDPTRPYRSGSYRFTRDGLPAAACTFLARGRLVTPVTGLKYARRLGIPPTPIPYGLDAIFFAGPARLSASDGLAQAEGGALVLNVLGVHTLDPASGDFSLSAPQVLRLGPSGPEGRLRATISGNLFDLLRSDSLRFVEFEGEDTAGLLVHCRLDPR